LALQHSSFMVAHHNSFFDHNAAIKLGRHALKSGRSLV